MKWRPVVSYLLGVLWACALVLWPRPTDVGLVPDEVRQAIGEGLYKLSLTKANFGLLGVHFYQTNEGRKQWRIHSEFAELHRKDNYAFMQTVTADFLASKTGNVVVTRSRYGRSLLDREFVELTENVSIQSKRGYLFNMEKLVYDGTTHAFTSDDAVQMKGPNTERPAMLLKGVGLVGDIDTEHFTLKKNVQAQRRMSRSGEWMRITSRSGEFFTDEQRAVFLGKVKAVTPQFAIDGDLIELTTGDEQESLSASGNVTLKHKDRVGTAETALMDMGSNRIVLAGKAKVDAKDGQVTGRRIVLFTDDDRVEVEEAEGRTGQ